MDNNAIDLFAIYLAKAEAERSSLDEYLAKHTQSDEVLQNLVSLALYLQRMPSAVPSEAYRRNSYMQLMKEIKAGYRSVGTCKALQPTKKPNDIGL